MKRLPILYGSFFLFPSIAFDEINRSCYINCPPSKKGETNGTKRTTLKITY